MKMIDMTGKQVNGLTVIGRESNAEHSGNASWLCRCVCGSDIVVTGSRLRAGAESCGCINNARTASRKRKHGLSASPTHYCWAGMIQRCTNPRATNYERYGGRGIRVCDRWLESFELFLDDMGSKPRGLTLDRIDNDGDYTPDNCRWATRKQQSNNRACNVKITIDGETKTVAMWSRDIGIPDATIRYRLKAGWPEHEILNGRGGAK